MLIMDDPKISHNKGGTPSFVNKTLSKVLIQYGSANFWDIAGQFKLRKLELLARNLFNPSDFEVVVNGVIQIW